MKTKTISLKAKDLQALDMAAKDLLHFCKNEKKVAFYGQIGAGKTTFIKQICRHLGVSDLVTSPTFSLVHEYQGPDGPVYHIDLYRLNSLQEALDIDIPGYLEDENFCFVEWPELIEDILPEDVVRVKITINDDLSRNFAIELPGL